MSCYLRVGGKDFNVDAYLKEHPCQVFGIYRRGEPKLKTKPEGPKLDFSGFNIGISEAGFENLEQQIQDAIAFLEDKENSEQISILQSYPGVEGLDLDFGVEREDRDKFPVKWYRFPEKLIQLAGNLGLGLEITFY